MAKASPTTTSTQPNVLSRAKSYPSPNRSGCLKRSKRCTGCPADSTSRTGKLSKLMLLARNSNLFFHRSSKVRAIWQLNIRWQFNSRKSKQKKLSNCSMRKKLWRKHLHVAWTWQSLNCFCCPLWSLAQKNQSHREKHGSSTMCCKHIPLLMPLHNTSSSKQFRAVGISYKISPKTISNRLLFIPQANLPTNFIWYIWSTTYYITASEKDLIHF